MGQSNLWTGRSPAEQWVEKAWDNHGTGFLSLFVITGFLSLYVVRRHYKSRTSSWEWLCYNEHCKERHFTLAVTPEQTFWMKCESQHGLETKATNWYSGGQSVYHLTNKSFKTRKVLNLIWKAWARCKNYFPSPEFSNRCLPWELLPESHSVLKQGSCLFS